MNALLKEEVEMLQSRPGCSHVKVLSGIGDIATTVSLDLCLDCVRIKFQLEDSYPHTQPVVVILLKNGNEDFPALTKISAKAEELIGKPMLLELVSEAEEHFKAIGNDAEIKTTITKQKRKQYKRKSVPKSQICEEEISGKLPPMKTATDVINRIQWDSTLSKSDFTIGYIDRFLGLLEQPFEDFTWEDLSVIDYDTFAIPKHRIVYFKLCGTKVWDKNERLDLVFGSTGSDSTIDDVINATRCQQNEAQTKTKQEHHKKADINSFEKRRQKKRMTHFLSIPVVDESIITSVGKVKTHMSSIDSVLNDYFIPNNKLHITLLCLKIQSQAQLERVMESLNTNTAEIQKLALENLVLKGVGDFHNKILYTHVCNHPLIAEFVKQLTAIIGTDVIVEEVRDTYFHMSLMRLRKDCLVDMSTLKLDQFENVTFGAQAVTCLQLCESAFEDNSNESYKTVSTWSL